MGWKRAVKERDNGTYHWTLDRPIDALKKGQGTFILSALASSHP